MSCPDDVAFALDSSMRTFDAMVRSLRPKHWVGELPLVYQGETIDGRKRLAAYGGKAPGFIEVQRPQDAVAELARRRHFRRACQLLDASHFRGSDARTLRALTGLSPQLAGRVVRERKPIRAKRLKRRHTAGVVRSLEILLERHELEDEPITAEAIRAIIEPWQPGE